MEGQLPSEGRGLGGELPKTGLAAGELVELELVGVVGDDERSVSGGHGVLSFLGVSPVRHRSSGAPGARQAQGQPERVAAERA